MASPAKYQHLYSTFRNKFHLQKAINWYPGHMMKGLLQIQAKMRAIDCVVEIHDARIPFTGRNLKFQDITQLRPHILLLNKSDLVELSQDEKSMIVHKLKQQNVSNVFFTNFKSGNQVMTLMNETILPTAIDLIQNNPRYNRQGEIDYNFLCCGVPNVGKSTFINTLRQNALQKKGQATIVGATPGVTKSVLGRIKVSQKPLIYVFDSPGIVPPKVPGLDAGMRLAACNCLPEKIVGQVDIADYILFFLNSRRNFTYVDYFDLGEPMDDIKDLLYKVAIANKLVVKSRDIATGKMKYYPNFDQSAQKFFAAFREGHLGKVLLDHNEI